MVFSFFLFLGEWLQIDSRSPPEILKSIKNLQKVQRPKQNALGDLKMCVCFFFVSFFPKENKNKTKNKVLSAA